MLLLLCASALPAAPLGIMVPAYFYPEPGGLWHSMSNAATRVPLTAILNPDSGPGASRDPAYAAAITNLQRAGGRVIGYVATGYSSSNSVTVKAQIDLFLDWYAVNGIFLDEMTDDDSAQHVAYYADIYQFVKAHNPVLTVTGNPGNKSVEAYLTRPAVDMLVVFEDGAGYNSSPPDAWVTNHLARHFVHLPYAVPSAATMTNYVQLARQRNAGWVYITDDSLVPDQNPWDTLPAYWLKEVEYIRALNLAEPPIRLTTGTAGGAVAIQLQGAPGTYEWQSSTDLLHWTSRLTNFSGSGYLPLPVAATAPRAFFRATQ